MACTPWEPSGEGEFFWVPRIPFGQYSLGFSHVVWTQADVDEFDLWLHGWLRAKAWSVLAYISDAIRKCLVRPEIGQTVDSLRPAQFSDRVRGACLMPAVDLYEFPRLPAPGLECRRQ